MPGPLACARGSVALSLLLAGCGYVGEPLPPSLGIPNRIADLSVVERGARLVIRLTVPELTTDGVVLRKVERLELRAGAAGQGPFDLGTWAARARAIDNQLSQPGPAQLEIPARDWVGDELIFAARAWGRKGRASQWSNLVVFRVAPPLAQPAGLQAEAVPEGVRLTWQAAPGAAFRVLRNGAEVALADASPWVDAATEYGKTYRYAVQAFLKAAEPAVESELSEPAEITPLDRFPPAVPVGLAGVASVQSIELSWERNTEPDLKGYYLYRSVDEGPFERLGEMLETPVASDRAVQAGRRYRYAVSAVDRLGNESARSAPVEIPWDKL